MATNWQPPFGLPFPPFPPPPPPPPPPQPSAQPQQQPQSDGHSGPSDAYRPPPANAFVPPPGWNIPGLNVQAHTQNAQQPQYPSAWPPNFPTPDQLSQWNQLQVDMQQLPFMMMQNPTPIPGLGFAPNPPPQSPFQSATPTHPFPALPANSFPAPSIQLNHSAQSAQNHMPIQNARITDVMDSDKEEGEVSEGDRPSQPPAVNGRTYPEPPRSAPINSARTLNDPMVVQQDVYNPDQPAVGQVSGAASQAKTTMPTDNSANTILQQRNDAKAFIKLLHNNNIGYHALAAEELDASSLRDLYRSLNLPSEPEPVPSPPKVNGNIQNSLGIENKVTAWPSAPTSNGSKPVTAVNTSVPPTKSAPSPANRKEYLAQLQAAKKARQNGGSKVTPPQKTPPPVSTAPTAAPPPQTIGTGNNTQQLTEAEKKAKTTELIRKRIEALKKNSSSPAAAASSKPPATGPAAGAPSSPLPKAVYTPTPATTASVSQSVPPSPFGNIPGLFMNSSPVVQPSQTPVTPGPSSRKRPFSSNSDITAQVGSDPGSATITRVASNNQVFDAMKADDRHDAVAVPTTQVTPIHNASQGTRVTPMIPGIPSRPTSVNPSTSGVSTPGPQTPSSTIRGQELDGKARKQAALKERLQKKIEEQKRQAERRLASAQNSPKSLSQQTPVMPVFSSGQGMSKEPKRRRKADIEAEQSALDVDIAENAAKLAQITKELELLTANDMKMRRDKERLQAELESLGIDTEGMPHAELRARRDQIEREQEAVFQTLPTSTNLPVAPLPGVMQSAATTTPVSEEAAPSFGVVSEATEPIRHTSIPGLSASLPSFTILPDTAKSRSAINQQTPTLAEAREDVHQPEKLGPAKASAILSEHETNSNELSKTTTPVDDEEDFYSPEPADVLPIVERSELASTSLAQAKSPSEEGEMAMSESDDEDYEPEEALEPQSFAGTRIDNTTEASTAAAKPQASSVKSLSASPPTNEEESYEPPDVDQPMLDVEPGLAAADSEPNVQQGDAEEEEMDMSTSSDDESDSDTSSNSSEEEPNDPASAPSSKNPGSSVTVADDLAPELQPQASAVASVSRDAADTTVTQELDAAEYEANPRLFVPYESPLKLFKSYRYHPHFSQDVPSGYLSMTFSHQIDPEKLLCANETSGAPCNDPDCPNQHFRDMNISGEKLLVQLGTANPGKTPEERQRWNDGLRSVLKDLRQKNTKDPNGIAMEIANYRRQFLQDDTRVVNL